MRAFHLATALGLSAALAAGTSASPITVLNPSFESPAPNAGNPNTYNIGDVTNWVESGAADDSNVGIMDQDYASGSDTTPTAPDGTQWLYIRASSTDTSNTATQNVGTIAANTTYTLSLSIGNNVKDANSTPVGDFIFGLYTDNAGDGIPSISLAQKTNADVTFASQVAAGTVTFDSTGSSYVGQNLYIYLASSYTTEATRTLFDNVSLSSIAVPEPASLALLGVGGLVMLSRRRRHAV